ncbi:MAG TPA: Ig-like domain-containing protein, partial [Iamia sp.]|nr:Ig-like domain-containing protein [Iamia sp.]
MKLVRPTSASPTPAARPPQSRAVLAALATLVIGVVGAVGLAVPPAAAAEEVATWTRLSVSPRGRAPAGTQLELVATVDPQLDPRVTGTVVFLDDGVPIGSADLALDIDIIYASITYTPSTPGPHQFTAWYEGNPPEAGPSLSSPVAYDVLPDACPDQARPGAGAVVRHAYLVALRRCPDGAGYAYWVGRLNAGAAPGAVAGALARSPEAIEVVVDDAYRRVLDRPADPAGRSVWAAKLR